MQKLKLLAVAAVAMFAAVPLFVAWLFECVKIAAYNAVMGYAHNRGIVLGQGPFAPDQFPSIDDFQRFRVQNADKLQITRASLYDTVLYPAAGAVALSLFVDPIGAGQSVHPGAAAGVRKTKFDTNMVSAGTLPRFQSFVVESIEIYFTPGSISTANLFQVTPPAAFLAAQSVVPVAQLNDVNAFYNSGWLGFDVSSGNILTEAPLRVFPPKADLSIEGTNATSSATTGLVSAIYGTAKGRPYELQPLVTLQETATFSLTLNWPNAIATPSTFNGQVRCRFDGYMIRATQ